jgi:hypothetical protein
LKVFTGGSLSIRELPDDVRVRISELAEENAEFLVGDAAGVDLAFQRLFSELGISAVTIYFSGPQPRNNVGRWMALRENTINAKSGHRMHTQKDFVMASLADSGVMVWDGESAGTIVNCVNLIETNKLCELWFAEIGRSISLRTQIELEELVQGKPQSAAALLEARTRIRKSGRDTNETTLF